MPRKIKPQAAALTAGDDVIIGTRGYDWIEGGEGSDTLTGGDGADKFVLRAGDGNDIVTDFDPYSGDRVLFDVFGTWSDIYWLGKV